MDLELQRIKDKDYSTIDETLFENMSKADNLTSTMSHLTQFQQFLMQQINTLNQPDQPNQQTAAASLQSSITKNFDTLRESLVHCKQITSCQSDNAPMTVLKKKISSLKEELVKNKEATQIEIARTCLETKTMTENVFNEIVATLVKERSFR